MDLATAKEYCNAKDECDGCLIHPLCEYFKYVRPGDWDFKYIEASVKAAAWYNRTSRLVEHTAVGSRVRTGRSGGQRARAPFRVAAVRMPADNTSHGATAPTDGALWRCPLCGTGLSNPDPGVWVCHRCRIPAKRVSG